MQTICTSLQTDNHTNTSSLNFYWPDAVSTNSVKTLKAWCTAWYTHTRTHNHLTALFSGLPGWAGTRKVKPIWICWSKRQWVAVASAGPYASLHFTRDRQPRQHPTTQFFTGRMPFLPPNQQRQYTEGQALKASVVHIVIVLYKLVDHGQSPADAWKSWYSRDL